MAARLFCKKIGNFFFPDTRYGVCVYLISKYRAASVIGILAICEYMLNKEFERYMYIDNVDRLANFDFFRFFAFQREKNKQKTNFF